VVVALTPCNLARRELYVYVLGLDKLFPKLEGHFVRRLALVEPPLHGLDPDSAPRPPPWQRLTTSIIAELAATVALVFIFMAIQSRFLSIFVRRDAEAKRSQRDEAAREEQLARANRRRSRVELNDWEEKYGVGAASSGASDEQTLTGGGEVDKVRSAGSLASLLPPGALQPTPSGSIDFLPKLGAYPPSPTLASPVDDFGRAPTRPVLASIQPSQRNVKPEWNSYVSTRKVAVAEPKPAAPPKRASRTLSLFSIGRRGSERAPSVKVHAADEPNAVPAENGDDGDDDDDVPLAAVRSLSTGALPRPSTMYDLTSASAPNLSRPANGSGTSLAPPPRSHSRMSLAMPAVLAAPPAASPPLSTSPQRPATLARVGLGRSSTLLDLTAPSTFDPYHDRARQVKHEASKGPERIAVGERRRVQSTPLQVEQGTGKGKGKAVDVGGGARIMDFGELEDKHRKRLSTCVPSFPFRSTFSPPLSALLTFHFLLFLRRHRLQSTAHDKLTSSAALARFQAQQRAEAEAQRKREARRSVDSNLHLLGGGARRASSPDQAPAQATRKRASASMGSLSGLLKRGAPSSPPEPQVNERRARTTSTSNEREEDVPLGALRREQSSSTSALARPERTRRASTQALVTQQQQQQQQQQQGVRSSAAPVRPSAQRRHSLGTLLEVSSSRDDGAPASVAAPSRAPPSTSARVDKVAAWRRSGSLGGGGGGGGGLAAAGLPAPPTAVAVAGVGEAALLQRVADKAAPKKKHDWLQY